MQKRAGVLQAACSAKSSSERESRSSFVTACAMPTSLRYVELGANATRRSWFSFAGRNRPTGWRFAGRLRPDADGDAGHAARGEERLDAGQSVLLEQFDDGWATKRGAAVGEDLEACDRI